MITDYKTIRILFYRAKLGDGHIVDNCIDYWTSLWNWPPKELRCSHCEIWTPDEGGNFSLYHQPNENPKIDFTATPIDDKMCSCTWTISGLLGWTEYFGDCWTSTMRFDTTKDSKGGVCVRPASQVLKNPERWFYCEIPISDKAYEWLLQDMAERVEDNEGYDMLMILSYFWFTRVGSPYKDICSEFVARELLYAIDRAKVCIYEQSATVELDDLLTKYLTFEGLYKDAPSPVRLALWLAKCSFNFYDLKTGEMIIVK